MKTLIKIVFLILLHVSANAQEEKIFNVCKPEDWSENTFWDSFTILESDFNNQHYLNVIKCTTAGLSSPNKIQKSHLVLLNYLRACAKFSMGDVRGALTDISIYTNFMTHESAIKITNKDFTISDFRIFNAFMLLGRCQTILGNDVKAINVYNQVLGFKTEQERQSKLEANKIPRNAEIYLLRGMTYSHMSKKDQACNDFSIAGELGDARAYELIKENCQ